MSPLCLGAARKVSYSCSVPGMQHMLFYRQAAGMLRGLKDWEGYI